MKPSAKHSAWPCVRFLLRYVFHNRGLAILCTVCVILNSIAGIAAPYLLKPIINDYIPNHAVASLMRAVILLAGIYLIGVITAWVSARLRVASN